jgi:uncharacterized damage-inducible protein DinB
MTSMKTPALLLVTLLLVPMTAPARQAANTTAPRVGFRAEFLRNLDDVEQKYVSLANATPQARYGWRPAEGVRSISEVFMHVASSNYYLATFLGVKPPADSDWINEKVTEKEKVVAALRKSFADLRLVAIGKTDAELETKIHMFGSDTSERAALMTILSHVHEHLGQSVAYARMNGVIPPWSRNDQ